VSLTISPTQIVEQSQSPLLSAPHTWPRHPLGDVATVLNGFAFKSKQFIPNEGKPLIRIRDIFNEGTTVGFVGEYDERYLVRPGELLVGMDGDFNCTRWRGPEGLLNQRVCKVTPKAECLDLDYLTFILPGYLQAIHDATSATTVTHLSSRDIAQIPIPLPPLTEQKGVAHVISMATAKQKSSALHTGVVRRSITRLRQSVLTAAYSGRLTTDWRRVTEENTDDFPSSWRSMHLSEVIESSFYGPRFSSDVYVSDGIPTIRTTDMDDRGNILFRDPLD
jgi:type I restriction enzyme S subunit